MMVAGRLVIWATEIPDTVSVATALARKDERPSALNRRVTEQNVLLQMQHLRTHPSVAGAMAREELTISGWVYDIASGEVRICEEGGKVFIPVDVPAAVPADVAGKQA